MSKSLEADGCESRLPIQYLGSGLAASVTDVVYKGVLCAAKRVRRMALQGALRDAANRRSLVTKRAPSACLTSTTASNATHIECYRNAMPCPATCRSITGEMIRAASCTLNAYTEECWQNVQNIC
jgi:hypothetical protein